MDEYNTLYSVEMFCLERWSRGRDCRRLSNGRYSYRVTNGAGTDTESMFGTSGVRGPVGETVTAELALSIGRALGIDCERVVVGRDPRASGEYLQAALV